MKRVFSTVEFFIPAFMLVVMLVVVNLQVFMRFVLQNPLSWPEEISRWCLVWITFAGLGYGAHNEALVRIDFFVKRLFPKGYQKVILAADVVTIFFFAYLCVCGILYTLTGLEFHKTMAVTGVPTAISNCAIAVGALLATIRLLIEMGSAIGKEKEEKI